jgi:hypothetical protein
MGVYCGCFFGGGGSGGSALQQLEDCIAAHEDVAPAANSDGRSSACDRAVGGIHHSKRSIRSA